MSIGEVHVGDIGTIFRHTVYDQDGDIVDISTADPIKIIFNKPDGSALVKTAELTGDGTDGQMEYTTITADLSVAGEWQNQGKVTISGSVWYTDIQRFLVFANLAET